MKGVRRRLRGSFTTAMMITKFPAVATMQTIALVHRVNMESSVGGHTSRPQTGLPMAIFGGFNVNVICLEFFVGMFFDFVR